MAVNHKLASLASRVAEAKIGGDRYPMLREEGVYEIEIKKLDTFETRKGKKPVFIAEVLVIAHLPQGEGKQEPPAQMRVWWQNLDFDGCEGHVKRFVLGAIRAAAYNGLVKNGQSTDVAYAAVSGEMGESAVTEDMTLKVIGENSIATNLRMGVTLLPQFKNGERSHFPIFQWGPPGEIARVQAKINAAVTA